MFKTLAALGLALAYLGVVTIPAKAGTCRTSCNNYGYQTVCRTTCY